MDLHYAYLDYNLKDLNKVTKRVLLYIALGYIKGILAGFLKRISAYIKNKYSLFKLSRGLCIGTHRNLF
ncbi:uncharacterized protein TRIREDRAFT_112674 [Trichoderma reesei QM6a]|uniref:Predicted protein n=1 Tax=Hypocrea jecorina (strain QM6a) TaxID=431241 RepID=G0RXN9_HYPJQ|nr:uncharacterized protein TRIREDRAFT_112674 [Trichoderma reesei QM6a]EGR44051.1 predicted protein [Trichoderma reesei QM6a]